MTTDEMLANSEDLFALAPSEGEAEIDCPSCGITFHCQGGYRPTYSTSFVDGTEE